MRRTYRAVVALIAVALFGVPTPAGAHTEVLRASPSPGAEVEAPVDAIELLFLDPVQPGVVIDVTDGLGDEIRPEGAVELSADRRTATQRLPDLEEAGDYVVEYTYTAEDGDTQRETYRFTIVAPSSAGEPTSVGAVVGMVAAGAVVVAGVVLALLRRRRTP